MFTAILKTRQSELKLLAILLLVFGSGFAHAADPAKGKSLYAMHCASCHGAPGIRATPGSPDFTRSGSLLRPDVFLLNATKVGKNAMPSYAGIISDRDILDMIAYMRTLN